METSLKILGRLVNKEDALSVYSEFIQSEISIENEYKSFYHDER